jgi:2,3-dihydroxyphenylpropionate 1,2-dioxygenase
MPVQLTCCSHSPLMATDIEATDLDGQQRFFSAIDAAAKRLADFEPDVVVAFYPDHMIGFFLDLMPVFCVGLAAETYTEFSMTSTPLRVPKELGIDLVRHLLARGFDTAFSHKMTVDHGVSMPLTQLTGALDRYEVLPIFINCVGDPRPSFERVRLFGAEVGRFLASTGQRVAVVGSGGLSHDSLTGRLTKVTPERFLSEHRRNAEEQLAFEAKGVENARGLIAGESGNSMQPSAEWDERFLESFVAFDADELDAITDEALDRDAGSGTHEVRTWVAAAAAAREMGDISTEVTYYRVIPEWITGMGVVVGSER